MTESLIPSTTPERLRHWSDQCATAAMREAAAGCVRPATEWADLSAKLITLRDALFALEFEVDAEVVDANFTTHDADEPELTMTLVCRCGTALQPVDPHPTDHVWCSTCRTAYVVTSVVLNDIAAEERPRHA